LGLGGVVIADQVRNRVNMSFYEKIEPAHAMASPWRRRRVCALALPHEVVSVALRRVSGSAAWLETTLVVPVGTIAELRHPDAGTICGRISAIDADGLVLGFDGSEAAVAFALGATIADMTAPN
jgi:hypothetical protein